MVDYDEDYDEVVDGWLECPMEKGLCVTSNGKDQNSGVKKLNAVDGNNPERQQQCLELCFAEDGATGCEVVSNQGNRGCYVHTQEIARGNAADNHECWIFSKCESTRILIILYTLIVIIQIITITKILGILNLYNFSVIYPNTTMTTQMTTLPNITGNCKQHIGLCKYLQLQALQFQYKVHY